MTLRALKIHAQDQTIQVVARASASALGEPYTLGVWHEWQYRSLRAMQSRITDNSQGVTGATAFDRTLSVIGGFATLHQDRLRGFISILEAASLISHRVRFSALQTDAQDDVLNAWATSKIPARRAAFHGLKSVCMMGFYSDDQTWNSIGYSLAENPGIPARLQ